MIYFIAALYNEEDEIRDLLSHVLPYVSGASLADDESSDKTVEYIKDVVLNYKKEIILTRMEHTGLPETVKAEALKGVPDGSWVIMLDADERFAPGVLDSVVAWINSEESDSVDYVYCQQLELIDGKHVRTFQKSKIFRKEAIEFPRDDIHKDDTLIGNGIYRDDWIVLHRKSISKQITREIQYLSTYKKLLEEGKIDEGRYDWLKSLHHYVR